MFWGENLKQFCESQVSRHSHEPKLLTSWSGF